MPYHAGMAFDINKTTRKRVRPRPPQTTHYVISLVKPGEGTTGGRRYVDDSRRGYTSSIKKAKAFRSEARAQAAGTAAEKRHKGMQSFVISLGMHPAYL